MKFTRKNINLFIISTILVIIAVAAAFRYLPLNKILRVGAVKEAEYINQPQILSNAPNALSFDFEVDQNTGSTTGLYKGISHSGSFSAKVFGKNTYSPAIERKVGDVGLQNLDAAGMSAWLYIFPTGNEVTGAYVFSMNNDLGVNVCWKSISVSGNDLPMGKWFKISGLLDLSGITMKENFKIQVYFWNNSPCDILVDDFYIVFGGQKPRRGDSTLVDMTRGSGFKPRFNYPPFPFHWLTHQEIGNQNSAFLIQAADLHEGEIGPYDTLFTGNFTGNIENLDDLLLLRTKEIYHFCKAQSKFFRIRANLPADFLSGLKKGKTVTGKFTGTGSSQILIITPAELQLSQFEPVRETCSSGNALPADLKLIWKTPADKIKGIIPTEGCGVHPADVDGDGISELLITGKNGSWALVKLSGSPANPLNVITSGIENPVPEWKADPVDFRITTGRFLAGIDKDLVLTVFASPDRSENEFSLRKYDATGRKFVPVFSENGQFIGKTIGWDTLKPADEFFVLGTEGKRKIFRYNRDWRFDLKEIEFSDNTFHIVANLDFWGFDQDRNPKYFEVLRIIPGNFLDRGMASLMVIGRNCKTRDAATNRCTEFRNIPFLPNTLQFYSFLNH